MALATQICKSTQTNIFGDEVGGNKETGTVRYGLSSMMTDNMTQFGPVVQVPLPKSPARLKMESFPSIIGMLSKMAPGQTVGMIDSQNLPDGIPSASMGIQKYEDSKKQAPPSFGQFLQGIFSPPPVVIAVCMLKSIIIRLGN